MKLLKVAVVFAAVSSFVLAQNMPTRGPVSFDTYDLNKDGKITQQEFDGVKEQRMQQKAKEGRLLRNAGNAAVFSDIDVNGNGYVDRQEYLKHQEQRMQDRINNKKQRIMKGQGN